MLPLNRRQTLFGFALAEVLLGSVILAIGAAVICGLCRKCVINNVRGIEYEQAVRLLDECLDQAATDEMLDELIMVRTVESNFGQRYPDYSYTLDLEMTDQADLYEVTAVVVWEVLGKYYQLQATTLIFNYVK
ncbi:MAG: hypothetical protein GY869_11985 [Planctomycetes bacterium]|nr:hypothetical protein [Planctomycetota bacterium]